MLEALVGSLAGDLRGERTVARTSILSLLGEVMTVFDAFVGAGQQQLECTVCARLCGSDTPRRH
jgi:hypothetical protein